MPKSTSSPKEKLLNLVHKPLSFAIDGHAITIREDNMGEVVFFQISGQKDNIIEATGISSFRMSLDQLKSLNTALAETIQKHEDNKKNNNRKK